ncbi:hypothetical protein CapIbe_011045 [Capra ibex]
MTSHDWSNHSAENSFDYYGGSGKKLFRDLCMGTAVSPDPYPCSTQQGKEIPKQGTLLRKYCTMSPNP